MRKSNHRGHKIIFIVTGLLVVLLTIVLLLSVRITEVSVSGNKRYTQEEITDILFDGNWDRNAIYCYYKYRFQPHETIPFVEDYKIVYQSPTQIEVIIYEKSVVGYVSYMGSNMYFDKDGIIVESSSEMLEGIPLITGLQFGHIVLYRQLPVADSNIFEQIMNLTQLLSTYEIEADKIYYDSSRNITMTMGDIVVKLGTNKDINGKISELNDMLPVLEGKKGTLQLDTYDETNPSQMFSFK